MRKLYLLKFMLLLCALVAGSERVGAEEGDILNETFEDTSTTKSDWTFNQLSGHTNGYGVIDIGSKYQGSKGLHLGSGSNAYGSATTPTLSSMTSNATMTFWAKTNTNNHSLKLSATGCTLDKTSIVIANGTWTKYTVNITNGTSSAVINFYKDGTTQKYIYIDNVVITSVSSVAAPTFSPVAGTVAYGTTVELSQESSKPIYYTTDGSTPTSSSTQYSSAITIDRDMTITAIAVDGSDESDVVSATYTVQRPDAPTFSDEGEVESGTEVTVTAPSDCTLFYTTNDDDPITLGTSAQGNSKTFTITEEQTIKAVSKDSHGFYSEVSSATYSIAVFSDPTFSVADMTLAVGDQGTPVATTNSSGDVTYVSGNTSIATVVDGKINAVAKGTATITAYLSKDVSNYFKAASTTFEVTVNLAPVWESTSKGIDELTYSSFGFTGETGTTIYDDFSDISSTSKAKYAGQAAKQTNLGKIQIRSKNNNSGIVSTTSGGKARRIEIDWNSSTSNGRYVSIYGRNKAYTDATELFDNDKCGTLIGTIKYGTNTELTIEGDYSFIGIKASDALYMNNITIYWEGDAVSLSDASNYTPYANDYAKVTLNREFNAGWNGVVLPFDLTTDVKTALGASEVKTLESATEDGGAVTLNFTDATLPVAAGTPVMVNLGAALESGDVVINGAEIKETTPTSIVKEVEGTGFISDFTFTGTYINQTITDEAYFVAGTKFYHKAENVALDAKPFRAYIIQETVSGGARKDVNFNLDGTEASGIADIKVEQNSSSSCYDLQGRRIAQPKKGLYIVSGKKIFVK